MTTGTINSNDINSVSFPGSEEGLSLVELVGTVVVVCALSAITLRVTANAVVPATASTSTVATTSRLLLGAQSAPAASTSCVATTRVSLDLADESAKAETSAGVYAKFNLSATGSGVATAPSAQALLEVLRSASATAQASTAVASVKNVYLSAQASPSALVQDITTGRKTAATAVTVAKMTSVAATTARFLLPATGAATAAASAAPTLRIPFGAQGSATATAPSVGFTFKLLTFPAPAQAVAIIPGVTVWGRVANGAAATATAQVSAAMTLKYLLGAETTATVSSAIAALDYSSTIPAPDERRMTLIEMSRRMEVTT